MVSESRKQSIAWMETDYWKYTHYGSGAFGRARDYGGDDPWINGEMSPPKDETIPIETSFSETAGRHDQTQMSKVLSYLMQPQAKKAYLSKTAKTLKISTQTESF